MRQDELPLNPVPTDDRPGDDRIAGDSSGAGNPRSALTWTGIRRRIATITLAAATAIALAVWLLVPREVLIKPGPLASSHAQILAGTVGEQRCGSCHPPSSLSPRDKLLSLMLGTVGDPTANRTQSELCLDCHRDLIADSLALAAHNLPLSERTALTQAALVRKRDDDDRSTFRLQSSSPAFHGDANAIECATCHREHHGGDHHLSLLSDAQCQACHTQRFGAFATSHPDWRGWPYGRGGEIAFRHASHMNRHFPGRPGGGEPFDCRTCHPVGDGGGDGSSPLVGEVALTAGFQQSCGRCHDESMDTQLATGFDLVALPTLPRETLGPTDWPDAATGFPDGKVSPLTTLLLRENPLLASLLRQLGGGGLDRLDWSQPAVRDGGRQLAVAVRDVMREIATEGQQAAAARLARQGVAASPTRQLLRTLPPQLVEAAYREWFGGRPIIGAPTAGNASSPTIRLAAAGDDALLLAPQSPATAGSLPGVPANPNRDAAGDDLLREDPLLEDPLLEDPLLKEPPSPTLSGHDPRGFTTPDNGGWWIDHRRLAIGYRGRGHADPVMVGAIETFAQLSDADPVKQQFFAAPAAQACVRCHEGADEVPSRWKATAKIGRRSEFTKFVHRPHLSVSALGDCLHCHRINSNATSAVGVADFLPLGKQTCAACHTRAAAGDRCTQCHRYHIAR